MFHSKLLELYKKYFPKQRSDIDIKVTNPGCPRVSKMELRYLKIRSVCDEIKYKIYLDKLDSKLRNAEKNYILIFWQRTSMISKRLGKLWKILSLKRVKQIQAKFKLTDGSITSDKCLISETFNGLFVSMEPSFAKKIPPQILSPVKHMGQSLVPSMSLGVLTADEIHKVINSSNNGAAGYDELFASILKWHHCLLLALLPTYITFDLGVLQRELKLYCVFYRRFPNGYVCLVEYLEMLNVLNNNQFGLRKLHSFYMTLMALMDKLIDSVGKEEYVVWFF